MFVRPSVSGNRQEGRKGLGMRYKNIKETKGKYLNGEKMNGQEGYGKVEN